MKSSRVPFLIIFITLMVGFIAGFLVNGSLTRNRVKNMKRFFQDEAQFEERLMGDLGLSPETQEAIRPILHNHFQQMQSLHKDFRGSMKEEFQAFQEALSPHLSPEAMQALREKMMRRRPGGHHGGHKHGHPNPPPPMME